MDILLCLVQKDVSTKFCSFVVLSMFLFDFALAKETISESRLRMAKIISYDYGDALTNKRPEMFKQHLDHVVLSDPQVARIAFSEIRAKKPEKIYLNMMEEAEKKLPEMEQLLKQGSELASQKRNSFKAFFELQSKTESCVGSFLKDGQFQALVTEVSEMQKNQRLIELNPMTDKVINEINLLQSRVANFILEPADVLDKASYYPPAADLLIQLDKKSLPELIKMRSPQKFPYTSSANSKLSFKMESTKNTISLVRSDGKSKVLGHYDGKSVEPIGYFLDEAHDRIIAAAWILTDDGTYEGDTIIKKSVSLYGALLYKGDWR